MSRYFFACLTSDLSADRIGFAANCRAEIIISVKTK